MPPGDEHKPLRRSVYGLLIAIAFAMACARIASAQRVYEPAQSANKIGVRSAWPPTRPRAMPTFSSNDRSRWATIYALVHDHSYVIGERDPNAALKDRDTGIIFQDGWESVDRILDPTTQKFYSSKPPLLSTLIAGIYWLFHAFFGWSLLDNPATVVRTTLILVNALPFAVYLWVLTRIAERWGKTDWSKLFIVAAGAFATLVTPFLITLSNHTIGTFSVMLAWWSVLRIWTKVTRQETPGWYHFVNAGFFGAFAVTNELPALSFAVAILVLLMWWSPLQTLRWFVPAALIPVAAFFATNYAAVGQLTPAYAEFGGPWYEYEGGYWRKPAPGQAKYGIDWARQNGETRAEYALHMSLGHHGLFSLTPIWLLAVAAMISGCWRVKELWRQALARAPGEFPWFVQPLGLALTIVVFGFYVYKSDNYGGWSNGLRWMMWLTPIWLTCLLPMADRLATSRPGRWLAVVLLAWSVFSASYQSWNPWRHPWIYDLMQEFGWPGY
jgi:hypothetical protein